MGNCGEREEAVDDRLPIPPLGSQFLSFFLRQTSAVSCHDLSEGNPTVSLADSPGDSPVHGERLVQRLQEELVLELAVEPAGLRPAVHRVADRLAAARLEQELERPAQLARRLKVRPQVCLAGPR